eukprot:scaffold30024_cov180-Isochrysis_galbana.AAC.1
MKPSECTKLARPARQGNQLRKRKTAPCNRRNRGADWACGAVLQPALPIAAIDGDETDCLRCPCPQFVGAG